MRSSFAVFSTDWLGRGDARRDPIAAGVAHPYPEFDLKKSAYRAET